MSSPAIELQPEAIRSNLSPVSRARHIGRDLTPGLRPGLYAVARVRGLKSKAIVAGYKFQTRKPEAI